MTPRKNAHRGSYCERETSDEDEEDGDVGRGRRVRSSGEGQRKSQRLSGRARVPLMRGSSSEFEEWGDEEEDELG